MRAYQGREVELHCRLTLELKKQAVAFIGDRLDDSTLAQSVMKRGVFGSVFRDDPKALPNAGGAVVWEVQKSLNPPAMLKAYKPKLWLLGALKMDATKVYVLE